MKELDELIGGKYGYCYIPKYGYVWALLYWPIKQVIKKVSQVIFFIRLRYWSGIMSEARGLHWIYYSHRGRTRKAVSNE